MTFSILSFLEDKDTKANVPWETKKFNKDDNIVLEGTQGMEIFFIKSGAVHILASLTLENEQQKDKGIAKLSANEIFGELAIFDNNTRSATAVAATDCEIAVIDGAALLSYMNTNPEKGYQVLHYFLNQIAQRMRNNNIRANTIMEFYLQEQAE
ncbi:MAG: cyclic nucleotide-binding domain-containing protein [Methyloprofundus sp.]|nr:cyclic nucleotide-binding domain-containing protein [Methyloprofundus sp.]